jgi:hypothetical protein
MLLSLTRLDCFAFSVKVGILISVLYSPYTTIICSGSKPSVG